MLRVRKNVAGHKLFIFMNRLCYASHYFPFEIRSARCTLLALWQIGHMATIIIKIIIWKLELWTAHSWLKICTKSAIFWGKQHKFDASMGNNQYNLKKLFLFSPTVQRTALPPLLLSILIASLVRLQTSDHDNSSSSRLLSH